jgi:RNA polymerase sigma factor (sigma-70 family)
LLWKDELRKKKHVVHGEVSDLPEEAADVEHERSARLAEQVLAELGDRCRELLMYYYNARMKLKDIAVKMGYSSENTAKNQKYKCLETAKKKLCVTNSK